MYRQSLDVLSYLQVVGYSVLIVLETHVSTPKKPGNPINPNRPPETGRVHESNSNGRLSQDSWDRKSDRTVRGSAPMGRDARPPVKKK